MRIVSLALSVLAAAACILVCAAANRAASADSTQIGWSAESIRARVERFRLKRQPSANATSELAGQGNRNQAAPAPDSEPGRLSIRPLVTSRDIYTEQQLDNCEEIYFRSERAHGRLSVSQYGHMALMVKLLSSAYSDLQVHRYENYKELRQSGGPHANQELCLRQLEHLAERANRNLRLGFGSRDINFFRLMDTYGRVPAGMFSGDTSWPGAYDNCLAASIDLPPPLSAASSGGTRYCWASLRLKDWPSGREDEQALEQVAVIKTAVCVPSACDSISYGNKYQLIQQLIEFNAREIDLNQTRLTNLYCLPDEQSPLRLWWKSAPTVATVGLLALWLALLGYATYRDELGTRRTELMDEKLRPPAAAAGPYAKFYKSLSITSNLRSLFSTEKPSQLVASANSERIEHAGSSAVDLSMIEGIKVLAAMYIITGHVIMISTMIIRNGKDMAESSSVAFNTSNLMPAFAVNAFFAITGILTAYLMFKQNQSHSFITSPTKWFAFILYRYLRIMPMYALMVLYSKHLARYTGDGPLWDYGTSSLGARATCQQEAWAWTLLFGANFKSPLKHCVPSAWYLANDFQFFIVTPLFLALLHERPALGRRLLVWLAALGYAAGFLNVLASDAQDVKPIAQFMPHGFMTYVTFLYANYTQPQYRIPAYLIGLLLGHSLYDYERRQLKHPNHPNQQQQRPASDKPAESEPDADAGTDAEQQEPPGWPWWMRRYGTAFALAVVVLILLTPSIGSRLPHSKRTAKLLVAFIMPTYHVLYALAVGVYILLGTTGHGNALINGILSMRFWKPLARLSLCVVLVNVEVIAYIVQTHRSTHSLTNQYHTCLNLLAILSTYLVAIVACALFEAPVRAALNQLLAIALKRAAVSKQKAA